MCLITVPTVGTGMCIGMCLAISLAGGDSASHVVQCECAKHVVLLQAARKVSRMQRSEQKAYVTEYTRCTE